MAYKCPQCGKTMKEYQEGWWCDKCRAKFVLHNDHDSKKKEEYKGKIPEGCAACGGPYPNCKISCPLFDD